LDTYGRLAHAHGAMDGWNGWNVIDTWILFCQAADSNSFITTIVRKLIILLIVVGNFYCARQ